MKKLIFLFILAMSFIFCKAGLQTITVNHTTTICEGDGILLQGSYQKLSDKYYDSLKTAMNEDSIITTILTVNPSYFVQKNVFVCSYDSILINGKYEKGYGLFIDSFKTTLGCDSLIEKRVYKSFKPTTSRFGPTGLQSNAPGEKYQWLDCDNNFAVINGLTAQTVLNLKKGNYAVEVTKDGCTDTSECVSVNISIGLNQIQFASNLKVYPNPVSNVVNIDFAKMYNTIALDLITIAGQLIKTETFSNKKECALNIQQVPTGVYLLKIIADGEQATKRIVIN